MKVVKFITWEESEEKEGNRLSCMGGFFDNGMRWEDYKKRWKSEVHTELENLREAILKNDIKCTGNDHQYGYESCPLWDDGTVGIYSYRAWGDLMAAIWSTEDNEDYSYMSFYM